MMSSHHSFDYNLNLICISFIFLSIYLSVRAHVYRFIIIGRRTAY